MDVGQDVKEKENLDGRRVNGRFAPSPLLK